MEARNTTHLVELNVTSNGRASALMPARIDTTNAAAVEEAILEIARVHRTLTLDFNNVEYIASVGIRTIVKLVKQGTKITIVNTSEFVYSTLDMVGINELVRIYKKLRDVSVEGLTKIGQGGTASVYRLDEDKIIKVYHAMYNKDSVLEEKEIARKLFLAGVPTAVPYEVVTCGEQVAVIYECLFSGTINDILIKEPEKAEETMALLADFRKEMYGITLPEDFLVMKQQFLICIQMWVGAGLIKEEDLPRYLSYINAVPDAESFAHGDYHPGNVMKSGSELMLIDLPTAGIGHVIFDLAGCYTYLKGMSMVMPPEHYKAFSGLDPEAAETYWSLFLKAFFRGKDAAFIEKADKQISTIAMLRLVNGAVFTPDLVSGEVTAKALAYIDENGESLFSGLEF